MANRTIDGIEESDFGLREVDSRVWERQRDRVRQGLANQYEDGLYHLHTTKEGRTIPLYDVDDAHLMNIIRFHAEKIAAAIKDSADFSGPVSMLDAIMVGKKDREVQVESVKSFIQDGYMILGRYIVEGLRRRLLEETYSAASEYFQAVNALQAVDVDGREIKQIGATDD